MNIKYITSGLLLSVIMGSASLLTSCSEELEVGKPIDESAYAGIYETTSYLRDAKTGKNAPIIEIYNDSYQATVKMGFSKTPDANAKAQVTVDAAYLDIYNAEHGTDFALFPASMASFENGGNVTIDTKTNSGEVVLTLTPGDGIEEDKTYALPVAISGDNSNSASKHVVYLVKDMRSSGDCFKGEGAMKGCLFFEVNDANPLNALSFQLENGKYVWDAVVLFAANINYDGTNDRPYIQNNENVQFLLDNNEQFLQPLRRRGIKVILGLLGNHDQTGLAQLSPSGCKDFAREIAQLCKAYNLDGVNFDDEYSNSPDLSNPALTTRSSEAAARLCLETKRAMPDKLVTIYRYGSFYGMPATVDGVSADEWVDIAVGDYGTASVPFGGQSYSKHSGISMEFNLGRGGYLYASKAQSMMNTGYGWYMGFALNPNSNFYSAYSRMEEGMPVLFGSKLMYPKVMYKKNDPNPYPYN